jgi:aspartate ammonia-lyase
MISSNLREEKDFLGVVNIPSTALYGIHSFRARSNFPDTTVFHPEWYKALGSVKKACYQTAREFYKKAGEKISLNDVHFRIIEDDVLDKLILAATEIEKGNHLSEFIVPAVSGGAGTSINLNINEIITNRALQLLNEAPGNYDKIDPIEKANIFQSTNDVIPTSLKIAVLRLLEPLEESVNRLRQQTERLERQHQQHLRKAYTQMQEAVPSSFGRLFGTYSDALSRDWWRISKCFERIKVVNLGGSAIGSGITVPRFFIMEVVRRLQENTQLPITRADNLFDATSNLDSLVEVHGILKALAVNLEKMVSDIRLLSADVHGTKELELPNKQVGSSIMPGKVNPVIPEFVISSSHKVYANDMLIAGLCAQGCLELNAYIPTIGHALLESLKLLIASANTLNENLFQDLNLHIDKASESLYSSPVVATALVPHLGYNKCSEIALAMKNTSSTIFEVNDAMKFMDNEKLRELLKPENLLKGGFTISDISK